MDKTQVINTIFAFLSAAFVIYVICTRIGSLKAKNILLWLGIFTILILCYAFRFDLNILKDRMISVLIPSYTWTNTKGELVIARSGNGHFYINVTGANNAKIHFLIDTGASDIAITKADAIKLGFNPESLKYTQKYSTANGISYASPIVIKELKVGEKTFYNVDAHVTSGNLDISLLGMSLINKFTNFRITKDMLILEY